MIIELLDRSFVIASAGVHVGSEDDSGLAHKGDQDSGTIILGGEAGDNTFGTTIIINPTDSFGTGHVTSLTSSAASVTIDPSAPSGSTVTELVSTPSQSITTDVTAIVAPTVTPSTAGMPTTTTSTISTQADNIEQVRRDHRIEGAIGGALGGMLFLVMSYMLFRCLKRWGSDHGGVQPYIFKMVQRAEASLSSKSLPLRREVPQPGVEPGNVNLRPTPQPYDEPSMLPPPYQL